MRPITCTMCLVTAVPTATAISQWPVCLRRRCCSNSSYSQMICAQVFLFKLHTIFTFQIVFIVWTNVRRIFATLCTVWWVRWVRNRNFSSLLLLLFNATTAAAAVAHCYCYFCSSFDFLARYVCGYIMDMEQIHRQPTKQIQVEKIHNRVNRTERWVE